MTSAGGPTAAPRLDGPSVSAAGVDLGPGADAGGRVEVRLGGRRVWSFVAGDQATPWPASALDVLDGRADVELLVDGERRWRGAVSFGDAEVPTDLVDARGRRVSVNKWGNLVATFADRDEAQRAQFVAEVAAIVAWLDAAGYAPFVVGGTLLGAVRDGRLLDHDDDADLAWLSRSEHPADVALESFAMERGLVAAGYRVVRHSGAHLQLYFAVGDDPDDHYVDIFSAFFADGEFNEPIHVRTERIGPEQIEPRSEIVLEGTTLPAPADPEAWLVACYGEGWAAPDPAFRFETPRDTIRRFHGWFGALNTHRDFWNAHHRDAARAPGGTPAPPEWATRLRPGGLVVDVGCGDGRVARSLAAAGHDVIAVDYSWVAIDAVRREATQGIEARVVNAYDRREMIRFAAELVATGRPVDVVLRDVVSGVTNSARHTLALFLRSVLGPEGVGVLEDRTALAPDYDYDDPRSWHIEPAAVSVTAAAYGLLADPVGEIGDRGTFIITRKDAV